MSFVELLAQVAKFFFIERLVQIWAMWDYIYQININPNLLKYGSKLSYGL